MNSSPSSAGSAAGAIPAYHRRGLIKRYLYSRLWLRGHRFAASGGGEARFADEAALWRAIALGELWETARLRLDDFYLMDWVPLEPGLYHTPDARRARSHAWRHVSERQGEVVILSPHGKLSMVEGGIGCVRFAMRTMFDDSYKLLTATSTGVAHQGFVVALPIHQYTAVAEKISNHGAVRCTVTGELRRLVVSGEHSRSGQIRSLVRVEHLRHGRNDDVSGPLAATPLITFEAKDVAYAEGGSQPWFAFATCDPGVRGDVRHAKAWLTENYVRRYNGRVITDYDEWNPTIGAACTLRRVMDPSLSARAVASALEDHGMAGASIIIENLYAAKLEVEGDMSTNVHITGDGNVVGNDNRVVTTINKTLADDPDRVAVAEALALLRGEIFSLDVADRFKRRSERAIQDAEDELLEGEPHGDGVQSALARLAGTMAEAGEAYDAASGWGRRLTEVVDALSRLLPAALHWLPF